jgi:hypothetical protein
MGSYSSFWNPTTITADAGTSALWTISKASDPPGGQVPRGMKFDIFPCSETGFFVKDCFKINQ